MTNRLEYANPKHSKSKLAFTAMICSLCSGPLACVIGCAVRYIPGDSTYDRLILDLVFVIGGPLIFAIAIRMRLAPTTLPRDLRFANLAIIVSIIWGCPPVLFLVYLFVLAGMA